jgi:hypothetical protein
MQAHFHAEPVEHLYQKMRAAYLCLESTEWRLHCLPSQTHLFRRLAEPFLHGVKE